MNANPQDAKAHARGFSNDMSPEAISRRLEIVGELNRLCEYLGKATPITRKENLETETPRNRPAS